MNKRSLTVALAAAIAAGSLAGVSPASAATSVNCPSVKVGTLAADSTGRVWHKGSDLYACTTVYGHKPKSRRMGSWTAGTKVAFDGVNLAWTTRVVREGVNYNRLWAGNADNGKRWLSGKLAIPPTASSAEAEDRVFKLVLNDRGIAWTTFTGTVGMALESPEDDPTAVGTLPAPLTMVKKEKRLRVATYPDADPVQLGSFLKLDELEGDGDECGASNPYKLTFRPTPDSADVGAIWQGGWYSTNCS